MKTGFVKFNHITSNEASYDMEDKIVVESDDTDAEKREQADTAASSGSGSVLSIAAILSFLTSDFLSLWRLINTL
jgi:hypothetical protein